MKQLLFRFEADEKLGMGHAYRCVNIIKQIQATSTNKCIVVISNRSLISIDLLNESGINYQIIENNNQLFDFVVEQKIDTVINDLLNTEDTYPFS